MANYRRLGAGCGGAYRPSSATVVKATARSRVPKLRERMTEWSLAHVPKLAMDEFRARGIGDSHIVLSPDRIERADPGASGAADHDDAGSEFRSDLLD